MPLEVIVVGAGLGGLAVAIAFAREGHNVKVFEKSAFRNEVGAAIHLAPNATRIFRSWGVDLNATSPCECTRLSIWSKQGEYLKTLVSKGSHTAMGSEDDWLQVHRVDLHKTLWSYATESAHGSRVDLNLSCPVLSVDVDLGKVHLEDGREYQADLVIGADGLHSKTVNAMYAEPPRSISTGQMCYRFLVPTEKAERDLETRDLIRRVGLQSTNVFSSDQRRLIMYPCRSGRLLNIAAVVPERERREEKSSWLNSGSIQELMKEFEEFCPEIRKLCSMADDLKLWSLVTRDPPTKFHLGRLALIGDAAHPTLPHQGQGAAQAFEDAAALGALFTADTEIGDIDQRLQMYNKIRYKHAITVMFMSRVADEKRQQVLEDLKRFVPDATCPSDMFQLTWNSDPIKAVKQELAFLA